MKKYSLILLVIAVALICPQNKVQAQQYKLTQSTSMMGFSTESTIYVKGMRKRTESPGVMGMGGPQVTIEQCDLQRTIKLNDKKKLYFIEPFAKDNEEVIDDDAPVTNNKNLPVKQQIKTAQEKGGVIIMWNNLTDTGERKKMFGFNARHMWGYRKMKPSSDACTMKDSMLIKTDGWYIDLPQWNCVHPTRPVAPQTRPTAQKMPDCMDRFVSHKSGRGKIGFPLIEKTTMIMGSQSSTFETNIDTKEFVAAKLDSMLFEIPPGYTETKNEDDLKEKFSMADMIKSQNVNIPPTADVNALMNQNQAKKAGIIRIGVYEPKGEGDFQPQALQQYMVTDLKGDKVDAIAVSSEEEAKKLECDYTLASNFDKVKSATKLGGLLKAIKNTDPNAASSFNIQASLTLVKLVDGSTTAKPKVDGKYDGRVDEAAKKAMDDGCHKVLDALK